MSGSVEINGEIFSDSIDKNWLRSEQVRDSVRVSVDRMRKAKIWPSFWGFGVGTSQCETSNGIQLKRNAELIADLFDKFGIPRSNIIGIDKQNSAKETLYWSQRIQYIHGNWYNQNTWDQINAYKAYLELKYREKVEPIVYLDGFGGWVKDRAIFCRIAKELKPLFYYITISRGLGNFDSERFIDQLQVDMPDYEFSNTESYGRPSKGGPQEGVIPYSSTNLYLLQRKVEIPVYYGGDKYNIMDNCQILVPKIMKNHIQERNICAETEILL